jgi:hypothetical protein
MVSPTINNHPFLEFSSFCHNISYILSELVTNPIFWSYFLQGSIKENKRYCPFTDEETTNVFDFLSFSDVTFPDKI